MALVANGIELVVSLADNGGKPYGLKTYDLVVTDPTLAGAVVASILAKLNAVVDSVVAGYSINQKFIENALSLPAAGVQNENQAIITATVVGQPNKSASITIPAATIGVFTNTSGKGANVVDMGETIVQDYLGIYDPAGGNEAYISDGEQIVALSGSGKRRHVKNSNG